MNLKRKARYRHMWREWVRPVIPVIAGLLIVRSALADWNDVPTGSMKPTILEGDRIFVNKLAYGLRVPLTDWNLWERSGPERGDIVVFFSPGSNIRMVKRVVGVPGDTVALGANRLYVNGKQIDYQPLDIDYLAGLKPVERMHGQAWIEDLAGHEHSIMLTPAYPMALRSFKPIKLGAEEYFVMGDNRDNSQDSRAFGVVHRGLITGRATRVVLSVDPAAWTFRWSRLMRPLQ